MDARGACRLPARRQDTRTKDEVSGEFPKPAPFGTRIGPVASGQDQGEDRRSCPIYSAGVSDRSAPGVAMRLGRKWQDQVCDRVFVGAGGCCLVNLSARVVPSPGMTR